MITKSEPLCDFIASYQEIGLDVAVFPTRNGERFALRLIDPDEPQTGGAFIASFSQGGGDESKRVVEADRPNPEVPIGVYDRENKEAAQKLNALIHSIKDSLRFVVCHCTVDDDASKTFLSVAYAGRVASDAYLEAKEEAKVKTAKAEADAPAPKKGGKNVSK